MDNWTAIRANELSTLASHSNPEATSLANCLRNLLLHVIEPTAPSDSIGKKLMIASRIVRTIGNATYRILPPHDGCHSSGWKEEKLKQIGVFTSNRPFT